VPEAQSPLQTSGGGGSPIASAPTPTRRSSWAGKHGNTGSVMVIAANWDAIEYHPRLVFDQIGAEEEQIILWYLHQGRPFTVVIR
jgi:hypothetical protein